MKVNDYGVSVGIKERTTVKEILKKREAQLEYVQLKDKNGYPVGDWTVGTCKRILGHEEVARVKPISEKTIEIQLANFC